MVKEYQRGDSLRIIAERHSTSATTVNNRLREAGVATRLAGGARSAAGLPECAASVTHFDEGRGLYIIALADSFMPISRVAMAFLEQGPAQITFSASSMEHAQKTIGQLNAKGYCCKLLARVRGRWCRICHRRFDRPEGRLCDGCEWLRAVHGFEHAFGLCAADGERSLFRAFGLEAKRTARGFKLTQTSEAFDETLREIGRMRSQQANWQGRSP